MPVSPAILMPGDVIVRGGRRMTVERRYPIDNGWLVEWRDGSASGVFSVVAGNSVQRVPPARWITGNSGPDYRCES